MPISKHKKFIIFIFLKNTSHESWGIILKMKEEKILQRYIGIIVLTTIMFSSFISAQTMFAGESMTFEINLTDPVYIVTGNSSDLVGMNISFEDGNITISTVQNYGPDNFTLIFFDEKTKEIEKIIYRGGSSTTYKDKIIIQNQTIYVPEYIDVEKIVEVNNTNVSDIEEDDSYKLWHILLAIVAVGVTCFIVMKTLWRDEDE